MSRQDDEPYESDDPLVPRSPRLKKIEVNLTPYIAPLPSVPQRVSQPATRKSRKSNRVKVRPSPGDTVLLDYLGNSNRPDLAQVGGDTVLRCSSSSSEDGDLDDSEADMEDLDARAAAKMATLEEEKERAEAAAAAKRALQPLSDQGISTSQRRNSDGPRPYSAESDSAMPKPNGLNINGVNPQVNGTTRLPSLHSTSQPPAIPGRKYSLPAYAAHPDPFTTSPLSAHLRSPPSPNHRLPAIHDLNSPVRSHPSSPQSHQTLPSVRPMIEFANQANTETHYARQRNQSFSSTSGPSPTLHYSNAPSPFPPLNHVSPPTSLDSAPSPRDFANRPSKLMASPPYGSSVYYRRPSQASDQYPALPSASTTESYSTSPDTLSPGTLTATSITTPSERSMRMSIDGKTPQLLPLPIPVGQGSAGPTPPSSHTLVGMAAQKPLPPVNMTPFTMPSPAETSPIVSNGTQLQSPAEGPLGDVVSAMPLNGPTGVYKCDHHGCTAASFQTQYLLK
jgi:hypothetical protein